MKHCDWCGRDFLKDGYEERTGPFSRYIFCGSRCLGEWRASHPKAAQVAEKYQEIRYGCGCFLFIIICIIVALNIL